METHIGVRKSRIEQFFIDFGDNFMLALPIMIAQAANVLTGIVDSLMLAKVGEVELAASALGNSIFILVLLIGIGISQGLTPYVSYYYANYQTDTIKKYMRNSFVLNLLVGVIFASFIIGIAPILSNPTLKQDAQVAAKTIPYLQIVGFSLIPVMMFATFKQLADGMARTWVGLVAVVIGNLMNFVANYCLIYGRFGFPQMGVQGAAWGTFISRCTMLLVAVLIFHFKPKFRPYLYINYFKQISLKYFKKILKLGVPSALQFLFEVGLFSAAVLMVGSFGPTYQAAHQISAQVVSFTFNFASGLAVAATIRTSYFLGKRDFGALRRVSKVFFFQVIFFMAICAVFYIWARNDISKFFINSEQITLITSSVFIIIAFFQIFDGIQVLALGILKGLRDVFYPTIIAALGYWVLALPFAYYMGVSLDYKLTGVWMGLGAGLVLCSIMLSLRLYHYLGKRKLENRYEKINFKDIKNGIA